MRWISRRKSISLSLIGSIVRCNSVPTAAGERFALHTAPLRGLTRKSADTDRDGIFSHEIQGLALSMHQVWRFSPAGSIESQCDYRINP
jgi:hypothetical protein